MLLLALTLAAAAPADTVRPAAPAREPAPVVVVHRQPGLPVVAIRLSLLADDPAGHAGAGHFVQHLVLPVLQEQVARVGGRVQTVRSADALVYTVTGPVAELDYLAAVLREALRPRPAGTAETLQALNALAEERQGERETAPAYVRAVLRSRLFPDQPPAAGTPASLARLEVARLPEVWGEMYRPDRVTVVAVGDLELAAVERAFASLPPAPEERLAEAWADSVPAFDEPPQATRGWVGGAWSAGEAEPSAVSVAARLLRDALRRRLRGAEVEVEHWWTGDGQAVAAVVAGTEAQLPAARTAIAGVARALRAEVNDARVAAARGAVRRDMLFYARTPERMAEVLGAFTDRGAEGGAAQSFYSALGDVTADQVRAALEALTAAEPVTVTVPPQKLKTSP